LSWLETVTGIPDLLYDPFYLGGGTHENRHGQGLQTHIDFNYHPSERWHRRLNLIVYLNEDWSSDWGGNLLLFANPHADREAAQSIAPLRNRCVLFETTEHSWHGFDEIRLPQALQHRSRKSIALYFYSRERPANETAGKHSTHYVDAQLPAAFCAGHTLSDRDVSHLQWLLATRDAQLQRLYAENAALLQAQERGLAGKLIWLAKRWWVRYRR
jgi:2OG-Fe(II) oxygenase superfamily